MERNFLNFENILKKKNEILILCCKTSRQINSKYNFKYLTYYALYKNFYFLVR